MANNKFLFFTPEYKTPIWGGTKMRDIFGYDIPSDTTGECWAISAHEHGDCICISDEYKGESLSNLWNNHRELFGNAEGEIFPLLVKVLDAKEQLSIQVHPTNEYAINVEKQPMGKSECWYIIQCDEGAKLIVGHKAKTPEELRKHIKEGTITEILNHIPVAPGDFIYVPSGTIHVITGGVVLVEIQQNSDTTYRIFDYNRIQSNGKKRELHIDKAIDVIAAPDREVLHMHTSEKEGIFNIISDEIFSIDKVTVMDRFSYSYEAPFSIVSVVEGQGTVNGTAVKAGDHFIVPNGTDILEMVGKAIYLVTVPGKEK